MQCFIFQFFGWRQQTGDRRREALARFGYRPDMNIIFFMNPFIFWLPARTHWGNLAILYLSMKEGSLFCFVIMRSTKPGCFRSCSWCLWKALDEEGCMGLVPWDLDLVMQKVLEYWMISSLKIKLNGSWKFQRNWNVPLVLLERSWWAGFMEFIW